MQKHFKLKVVNGDITKKQHLRRMMDDGVFYDLTIGLFKKMLGYSKKYPKTMFVFKETAYCNTHITEHKTFFVDGFMYSKNSKTKNLY